MVGHPGVAKTYVALRWDYWWPRMHGFIQEYVRGYGRCQESKSNMHPNKPPIFATIAMNFIIKLPVSNGFDTILTITDYNCTKAMILLPCREEINALGVAKLYLRHMFPIVGLPE